MKLQIKMNESAGIKSGSKVIWSLRYTVEDNKRDGEWSKRTKRD